MCSLTVAVWSVTPRFMVYGIGTNWISCEPCHTTCHRAWVALYAIQSLTPHTSAGAWVDSVAPFMRVRNDYEMEG